mmetsp:Transcript_19197/g.44849  ORF Transcript_19197/g.44849 Transcript_19197/m.44849 type:complete len:95 (+) Transcript_19197:123-407(+)
MSPDVGQGMHWVCRQRGSAMSHWVTIRYLKAAAAVDWRRSPILDALRYTRGLTKATAGVIAAIGGDLRGQDTVRLSDGGDSPWHQSGGFELRRY